MRRELLLPLCLLRRVYSRLYLESGRLSERGVKQLLAAGGQRLGRLNPRRPRLALLLCRVTVFGRAVDGLDQLE